MMTVREREGCLVVQLYVMKCIPIRNAEPPCRAFSSCPRRSKIFIDLCFSAITERDGQNPHEERRRCTTTSTTKIATIHTILARKIPGSHRPMRLRTSQTVLIPDIRTTASPCRSKRDAGSSTAGNWRPLFCQRSMYTTYITGAALIKIHKDVSFSSTSTSRCPFSSTFLRTSLPRTAI